MKRKIIYSACALLLTAALYIPVNGYSQEPAPPPPSGHGANGNPKGTPIGGGAAILTGLALIYGGLKFYQIKRKLEKKHQDNLSVS